MYSIINRGKLKLKIYSYHRQKKANQWVKTECPKSF